MPAKSGIRGKSLQCLVCISAAMEVGLSAMSEMSETCGIYNHMWHLWKSKHAVCVLHTGETHLVICVCQPVIQKVGTVQNWHRDVLQCDSWLV